MKISARQRRDLYAAIAKPVSSARVQVLRDTRAGRQIHLDDILRELETEIWKGVAKTLYVKADK